MENAQVQPEPSSQLPAYDLMMKAGMHFGRKKTIFHPNMKRFVYGTRENMYILDLTLTTKALERVISFLQEAVREGKKILFVGTARQASDIVTKTARELGMPYVSYRWLGGTLTNFRVIVSRVKYLETLEREKESGHFEKYTKKERLMKEKEINGLRQKYDGLRGLTVLPEVVFVSSLKENALTIKEAGMVGLTTVGIVNTDSDPTKLTYPIPANDNSRKAIELVFQAVAKNLAGITPVPAKEPVKS